MDQLGGIRRMIAPTSNSQPTRPRAQTAFYNQFKLKPDPLSALKLHEKTSTFKFLTLPRTKNALSAVKLWLRAEQLEFVGDSSLAMVKDRLKLSSAAINSRNLAPLANVDSNVLTVAMKELEAADGAYHDAMIMYQRVGETTQEKGCEGKKAQIETLQKEITRLLGKSEASSTGHTSQRSGSSSRF